MRSRLAKERRNNLNSLEQCGGSVDPTPNAQDSETEDLSRISFGSSSIGDHFYRFKKTPPTRQTMRPHYLTYIIDVVMALLYLSRNV